MKSKRKQPCGGKVNCVASWDRVGKDGGVIYVVEKDCELSDIVKYMRNQCDPAWDPEQVAGPIHITTKKARCVPPMF